MEITEFINRDKSGAVFMNEYFWTNKLFDCCGCDDDGGGDAIEAASDMWQVKVTHITADNDVCDLHTKWDKSISNCKFVPTVQFSNKQIQKEVARENHMRTKAISL